MAIGGGVPSTTGLPTVKAFSSFTPTQIPPVPFFQSDDSNSYSIINAGRVAGAAVLLAASSGLFMPPQPPVAAPSTAIGVPIQSGGAASRITRVYAQSRFEPPVLTTVVAAATPYGWFSDLSRAPSSPDARVDTNQSPPLPQVNPVWWQQPLSVPIPAALVRQGFASVPFSTAQLSVNFTPVGWQGPLEIARRPVKAQADFASVPLYPVVAPDNNVTLDKWQSALSAPPPVAKAQAGFASVPYDTAQLVVTPPTQIGIPLFAGGAAPRNTRVYYQTRSEPPYVAPVVVAAYTNLFLQPLSTTPPVTKAQAGFGSVPFNTAQLAVNYTNLGWFAPLSVAIQPAGFDAGQPILVNITSSVPQGWYQALSGAPLAAKAQFSSQSQPLYVAPTADNNVTLDKWQSALSVAPAVIKAQAGFSSVPFDTAQAQPAGIAGMAWHTPLGTVPYRIAYGPQEFGYDAPRYGEIAPSPIDSSTRGSETILTDRRGIGAPGFTPRQYDEFLAAKRAALAKVKRLKKKPAAEELREAVAIASRAAGLLGDFSPSLEPVTEALRAAANADAAHAMQAAIDAVNAAQMLLRRIEDDEDDDEMLLLSI